MCNEETAKMIDAMEIKESKGPRHLDFYIKFYEEDLAEIILEKKQAEENLNIFMDNKHKSIGDLEAVKIFENAIEKAKQEVKESEEAIEYTREKISEFNKCKIAYAEDFKKGLYYDQDTGELINEVSSTIVPDNAYNPISEETKI